MCDHRVCVCHNCKSHRIIELDVADVILGQGDASILRVNKQQALREENDFS